jgi:hypothetical protein
VDKALLILHAVTILSHGGELCEDCQLCDDLVATATLTAEITNTGLDSSAPPPHA